METRVERGQASEDRVTGAIERQTSMAVLRKNSVRTRFCEFFA